MSCILKNRIYSKLEDEKTRYCPKCCSLKDINSFYKCSSRKDGLQRYCKSCKKLLSDLNPNTKSTKNKYYLKNIKKYKEYGKFLTISGIGNRRQKEYRLNNPQRTKARRHSLRLKELKAGALSILDVRAIENFNKEYFFSSSFTCEYCKRKLGLNYELEHLTPISRGGLNTLENLAISCYNCNRGIGGKRSKTQFEFRPDLTAYFNFRNYILKITKEKNKTL
jgi:hypothetical protein